MEFCSSSMSFFKNDERRNLFLIYTLSISLTCLVEIVESNAQYVHVSSMLENNAKNSYESNAKMKRTRGKRISSDKVTACSELLSLELSVAKVDIVQYINRLAPLSRGWQQWLTIYNSLI